MQFPYFSFVLKSYALSKVEKDQNYVINNVNSGKVSNREAVDYSGPDYVLREKNQCILCYLKFNIFPR